ncbi:MAG: site-specific integrase [Solirubrobacterales bacterium]
MRGSIDKRGSTWTVRYDEPSDGGRRQRRKGGFRTRREAQEWLAEQTTRIRDNVYVSPSKLTVRAFFEDAWLPHASRTVRPTIARMYARMVDRYIVPAIGQRRLQTPSGGDLNALYRAHEEDGLSASTIKLVHAVCHRAFKDAVRWDRIARNPAASADPPRSARARAQAWTASELSRFLEHVRDDRLFALWRLAATSGMRRGELAGLTWRALDLDTARLEVSQQLMPTPGGVSFRPPKSARSRRTIALDAETVEALRTHRGAQLLERDFAADAYADEDLVFCDELGGPINPQRLTDWFRRHRKAAGIPIWTLHTLRHTAATLMLTSGTPVHIVAARLGDTPQIVLGTYAHLLPQSDEVAAERVAAALTG